MMTRNADILFMAEYIKNVLYFATVRPGKTLKNTSDTHYFSIDDELVYENYYSDFGPLNLGCVYKYCNILNDKLKLYLNKQTIVHYTAIDPKKKANAAFLLGCYGVLYLSLPPRDALKPLIGHGQSYRPFQDATQCDSAYTISLMDCLQAIKKARELGLFNFQDFNYEEYTRLDNIQGGDLNWILPGKFLAFIGPVDYSVSLYHPPDMYIDYFLESNVQIVIRLNKRLYDGNVFNNAGIVHYDLFFPDGSCPPRHILLKFLQISEECDGALAVHCKAGLGRTGSLIGCYLIKHYRMSAHEAIAWMRICRPGSVIGHQQGWLEQLESWLLKQGNLYRKRTFNDMDNFPIHEFGLYSIAEKTTRQRSKVYNKSPSPPPPAPRRNRTDGLSPIRIQSPKIRDAVYKTEKDTHDWCVRTSKMSVHKVPHKVEQYEGNSAASRRGSGAGEPRPPRSLSRSSTIHTTTQRNSAKSNESSSKTLTGGFHPTLTTFRSSNGPTIKNVNDARKYLIKASIYNEEREKQKQQQQQLNSSIIVTPTYSTHVPNYMCTPSGHMAHNTPSYFSQTTRTQPQQRRRLGRSPSPPQPRMPSEQTRATNTSISSNISSARPTTQKFLVRDASKSTLRDALSRLTMPSPRDGSVGKKSVGAASLGARRDAPLPKQAPSVRSDERPLATQGDMLNSIKFQRRFTRDARDARDSVHSEKITSVFNANKTSIAPPKDKPTSKGSRINTGMHQGTTREFSLQREKPNTTRNFFTPVRPTSPKGRRNPRSPSFY